LNDVKQWFITMVYYPSDSLASSFK